MSVRDYTLTLDGTVQNLNSVLPAGEGDLLKYVALSAHTTNFNLIFVGSTERGTEGALSSTKYGWRIEIPVSGIPTAPDIIELGQNGFSLAELSVIGTNPEILHILAVR
jgi:hypothetical protein